MSFQDALHAAIPLRFQRVPCVFLALLAATIAPVRAQPVSVSAAALEDGSIRLSWPVTTQSFVLEQSSRLGPGAAWAATGTSATAVGGIWSVTVPITAAAQYFRLRAAAAPALTRIVQTSPNSGERSVSVQRETILDLSQPLAADTVLADDTLHAEALGRRLLSRKELSSDRKRLSLFYLEPVPAGAHVVVRFNGDTVRDAQGQAVDADADGRPGGLALIEFDTMNTAGLKGTGVSGFVFASDPAPSSTGFTNRPLAGVIISVDGTEERLRAETDENGFFTLSPCPTGTFFVHIDGRTALGSDWPDGAYYPVVGKTFEAVAGQTNSRPTGASEIYLPLIRPGTLQTVSSTRATVISFPPEVTANDPALAGVSITVPPNALFGDDGTRGGKVGLAPVAPDRIPSPLPPGLDLPLVITVQTDGPANFDQPVPVRFPNLPDPVTGEKLPPGAKSALWSFNHDTGRWELQGSMTVTADGNFVESDPGVGIRQPGWHGSTPGSTGQGGGGNNGPCSGEQAALENALLGCAIGAALELAELAPAIGCGISLASALASTINGCGDPQNSCAATAAYNAFFGVAGCIPGVGTFTGLMQCGIELGSAVGNLAACQELNAAASPARRSSFQLQSAANETGGAIAQQQRLSNAAGGLLVAVLGDARWMEASARDSSNMVVFATALSAALALNSDDASRVSSGERTSLLALPAPNGLSLEVRTALLDRFDRLAAGGITGAEQAAVMGAANSLTAISTELQNQGWTTMLDGLKQTWSEVVDSFDDQAGGSYGDGLLDEPTAGRQALVRPGPSVGPPHRRELLYRVIDQTTGFVRHGRTDGAGELSQFIVGANRDFILTYLDPITLEVGSVYFQAGEPGGRFILPRARLAPVPGTDTDQDGLTDLVEGVAGTSPSAPDTDQDGTLDLVEVQQGLNPLDGLALPQGLVANLPLSGRALGLHVEGSRVFVANGKAGLAVVNAADPLQPVVAGQIDLLGESFDVTFTPEHQVAGLVAFAEEVIPGERGLLHFVDVSDPAALRLLRSYSVPAVAIDSWNGLIYVALGQFALKQVRIYHPGTALETAWFETQDFATGLRVTGGRAYVATLSGLEIFDVTQSKPVRLGRLAGEFGVELLGRVHMVLDGNVLFVSKAKGPVTIDVSDPTKPAFVGLPPPNAPALRSLALNGAGRLLALTMGTPTGSVQGAATLSIYKITDPANLNEFQFSLATPGRARDLAMLNGFAWIADDPSGLSVMNFAAADLNRAGPAVTLDLTALDSDAATSGLQVVEGTELLLSPRVEDDVHLDRVELLVNEAVVETSRTYPVTLALDVPTLSANGSPSITFQMRAVDRSGTATLTDPNRIELTPDTQSPALWRSMPTSAGATHLGESLVLEFSERLQSAGVDLNRIMLMHFGDDGLAGGGNDQAVPLLNAVVQGRQLTLIPSSPLRAGQHQLTLPAGVVRDLAGNASSQEITLGFAVVQGAPGAAVWIADTDGDFSNPANWLQGRLPSQEDAVLQRFGRKPTVILGNAIVRNIHASLPLKTASRAGLTVLGTAQFTEPVEFSTGSFIFGKSTVFASDLSLTGGQVEANAPLEIKGKLLLNRGGSLSLDGPEATLLLRGALEAVNCTIAALGGAIMDLPQFVIFDAPGDFTPLFPVGTSFRAQGAGSRLSLPGLTSARGPVDTNFRGAPSLRFEADDGGTLRLPKLTSLAGRTALVSSGFDSLLEAPLLSAVMGTPAPFVATIEVARSGVMQVPALTQVTGCGIELEADGVLRGGAIEIGETSAVQGAGTIEASLLNRGRLVLDNAEPLVITGSLELAASSQTVTTLGLGLDNRLAGRIDVRGNTVLGGSLEIALSRSYTATAGTQFEAGVFALPPTGGFQQVNDASLGGALQAAVTLQPTALTVAVTSRP